MSIRVKVATPTVRHVLVNRWKAGRIREIDGLYNDEKILVFECERRFRHIWHPNDTTISEAKQRQVAAWGLPENVMHHLLEQGVQRTQILLRASTRILYTTTIECWEDHSVRRSTHFGMHWYLTFNYFTVESHIGRIPLPTWM